MFIYDGTLSFKTLLFNYFPKWKDRFTDTLKPCTYSFGYENVINKINLALDEYFISIYDDYEKVTEFLSHFWNYKRQETLAYLYARIKKIPEPMNPTYSLSFE